MTDYTERFRTLSIPQMQQMLAKLFQYLKTGSWADAIDSDIDGILEQPPPFNIDPKDEAIVDSFMAKRESGLKVTPMAHAADADSSVMQPTKSINEPSRIIRCGDLVVGKRYRIVEMAQSSALHAKVRAGDVLFAGFGRDNIEPEREELGWSVFDDENFEGYVTAVELVEVEEEPKLINGPSDADSLPRRSPKAAVIIGGRNQEPKEEPDYTIIRAAEGVTLEPGEYEIVHLPYWANGQRVSEGERFKISEPLAADAHSSAWYIHRGGIVTAVRRVDPKPASEPVAPAAGGERAIVVGSTWRGNAGRLCTVRATGERGVSAAWLGDEVPMLLFQPDRFREFFTWVSDPAPPQQPAERVEPVADDDEEFSHEEMRGWFGRNNERELTITRAQALDLLRHYDAAAHEGSKQQQKARIYGEMAFKWRKRCIDGGLATADERIEATEYTGLIIERDSALATVAKLTAELEAAKRERDEAQEALGSEITCPDCHDGGACLPGGCGIEGCTRCGETCRTCGGKVTITREELRVILATLHRQSARPGLDPKACGELIAAVRQVIEVYAPKDGLDAVGAFRCLDKLAAMLGVEVAGG